jgi:glucose/arabinose dehydrogenase
MLPHGGSIAWDAKGNMYLSTGDNASPRATPYAPIDEREEDLPGMPKSAANTNDLRGKICASTDARWNIRFGGNLFQRNFKNQA